MRVRLAAAVNSRVWCTGYARRRDLISTGGRASSSELGARRFAALNPVWWLSLIAILMLMTACSGGSASAPVIDSPAPEFELGLTTGETVSLEQLRGNPVILSFWATTCAPCRRELPVLDELAIEHADDGLTVLAINTGEPRRLIDEFVAELSLGLPVALDDRGAMTRMYEVVILPMTYFIDRDGVLRYRVIGQPRSSQLEHGLEAIM
ncbi:MAG: TlpA disulfide reductase family protein [Chloroflexi bacterium]|nr:TlpA disulfide reductase family protein [Chloroflexota bacterium]